MATLHELQCRGKHFPGDTRLLDKIKNCDRKRPFCSAKGINQEVAPMVWDVMVAAAFVVISVAVLACFWVKHVLSWLKKPHRRVLPFPCSMILSRHRFREIVRPHSYAWPYFDHVAMRRGAGSLKWSALFRRIWSNHKEDTLISHATIITLIASSAWCIRNQEALANLLSPSAM
jgi:hypothetical protein